MKRALLFLLFLPLMIWGDNGTNLLEQTSKAFTQIAKTAMPATVFIKATISQNGMGMPYDPYQEEFFRRFFGGTPQQPQGPQMSGGSGFLISSDGYVVTNNHVIQDASCITVVLNDGREFAAAVTGTDPRTDLAVLKIDARDLPCLSFGDSEALEIGEWVVAIGTPFALEASLTVGVVSAKGRQDLGITSIEDFIQTDAAINPGNSGGPLLNLQSQVIGVNTAIMSRSGGYMGIGFAIPSHMAKQVVEQIIQNGSVKRAYLGIYMQPIDKDLAEALNLPTTEGILVSEVIQGSPADAAGLKQGDVIVSYNGKAAKSPAKLRSDIALMPPGTPLKLAVLRQGKNLTLTVPLGTMSDSEVVCAEFTQKLGIEVENLTPELASKLGYGPDIQGVVISKVKQGSPAAMAGLRPYFLITGVAVNWNDQRPIHNTGEFNDALKNMGDRKHIILIVRQQNYQRYYTIRIN